MIPKLRKFLAEQNKENEFFDRADTQIAKWKEELALIEKRFNDATLDELKYKYISQFCLDDVEKIYKSFQELENEFKKNESILDEDDLDYLTDIFDEFNNKIENLIEDLETMNDAFRKIGDIDKGLYYFHKKQ